MNIWCNSIKTNDALFNEKSSSATVWYVACSRLSLREKENIFWSSTALKYPVLYIGIFDVPKLS